MRLHFQLLLPVCLTLCSNYVFAVNDWWQSVLSDQPFQQVKRTIPTGGGWYTCSTGWIAVPPSEEGLCLDDFHYYHQHLYGEVVLGEASADFVFLSEYQWQNWNDMILNLRKDGLVIRSVRIDDTEYDVMSALEQNSTEEVDKEVVLMMNRYPPEARRTIQWVRASEFHSASPNLNVRLKSDGEMIEMHVTRF